ncbi:NADH-cytochrome B5 reductase [Emiliania huxleyi CCMP1516]|uniref:FAD-binding FR-type domain-containing protein n=2 Tax=Emiliania huxleyi TaxID=2903 RepID=A0A0D3IPZ9_EMIH1|nr:hypothetical protein EMIHUDRAFT_76556 [Emiliania huxleyi CCMP1516]XP_005791843.1 NADH-cytochrome B5 reductase [Emiliania huxleyi CCMP1516]EOD13334.1 hypothetical protein EMIHUDRAFT_76556 [Emiliania huxleyi CCMP1516]EOD39414.1 NADH-cytochrome B5 reductase [Emiliania huxleyi CCMP1516]|eukprot:XP_005765763.1 hypothetical protein EMIHUDRAFT_76556 [Emiliania huxleyi CCMP1516]
MRGGGGGKPRGAKFLNKSRQTVTLGERTNISHDTVRFRFVLPDATPVLGLPVGKHFKLFAPAPKGVIERKYTPTTSDDEVGYVDLVIKVYKGGVIDRFPDGGKMSQARPALARPQYMDSLKVGDTMDIQGPIGMHEYLGAGRFKSGSKELACKRLGMMAGGTGITPMLQATAPNPLLLLSPLLSSPTPLLLPSSSSSCHGGHPQRPVRQDSDLAAVRQPDRVHYTLDRPPAGWKFSSGFITEEMISEHLPPPADDTLAADSSRTRPRHPCRCGPPPMIKFACIANLDKLGYSKKSYVAF